MSWGAVWWVAGVVLGVAVVAAGLARRGEPTVFRGRTLFRVAVAITVLSLVASLIAYRRVSFAMLIVSGVLLAASWTLRRYVLVTGHDAVSAGTTIGTCAKRLVLSAESRPHGFDVALPGGVLRLHVLPLGTLATLVRLAPTLGHRKVELFEQLFVKQYRRALPPIRLGGGQAP